MPINNIPRSQGNPKANQTVCRYNLSDQKKRLGPKYGPPIDNLTPVVNPIIGNNGQQRALNCIEALFHTPSTKTSSGSKRLSPCPFARNGDDLPTEKNIPVKETSIYSGQCPFARFGDDFIIQAQNKKSQEKKALARSDLKMGKILHHLKTL